MNDTRGPDDTNHPVEPMMEVGHPPDRRQSPRYATRLGSFVEFGSESSGEGVILDLSTKGCRIVSGVEVYRHQALRIHIHPTGGGSPVDIDRASVRWRRDTEFGVEFIQVDPNEIRKLEDLLDNLPVGSV